MLRLDMVSVRLKNPVGEAHVEIVRLAESRGPMPPAHEICEALSHGSETTHGNGPHCFGTLWESGDVSIVPLPWGYKANSA